MNYKYYIGCLVAILFLTGCYVVNDGTEIVEPVKEAKHVQHEEKKVIPKKETSQNLSNNKIKDFELKLAQLWVKIDDIEQNQSKQRARIKVLEKGLLLGITPEELLSDEERVSNESRNNFEAVVISPNVGQNLNEEKEIPTEAETQKIEDKTEIAQLSVEHNKSLNDADYEQRLAEAQSNFASRKYGKAIATYSSLISDYLDKSKDGSNHYWIALSWFNLKEYQLSEKGLVEFVKTYPNSQWTPKAYLYLAKTRFEQGFRESALDDLRYIIEQYPNNEAADMAKREITNMGRAL